MMIGLDSYIATKESFVGIDWLNFTSGAFKTAGGAATTALESNPAGAAGGSSSAQAAAAAEKMRLEAQKKADAQTVSRWKMAGAVGVLALAVGGLYALRHRKTAG